MALKNKNNTPHVILNIFQVMNEGVFFSLPEKVILKSLLQRLGRHRKQF